jgi:hypothetical protein
VLWRRGSISVGLGDRGLLLRRRPGGGRQHLPARILRAEADAEAHTGQADANTNT